jgi:Carboxypeptidase regulatory-like domain
VKRRLSLFLVGVLAIGGLAVAPAMTANAAGGTKVGVIKVRLTTPSNGNFPHKGFVVTASGMTKNVYKEAKTNKLGFATLRVPPGKYTITVATYRSDYRYAVVHQDYIAISRGQTKTIGMKMYKGAKVSGKVLTPTGFALKGATVAAVTKKGVIVASTTSTKNGVYHLAGLPTGHYAIVFNQRSYDDGKSKVVANYAWGYYKGSSLATAKYLTVYKQNRYVAATSTTGIDGPVTKGTTITANLALKDSKSGRLLVDHIGSKGQYLQDGSVYAPFKSGVTAKVRLHSGKYRLGVVYAGINYYYTGDGQTLTTSVTKATTYTYVGESAITVNFGPLP